MIKFPVLFSPISERDIEDHYVWIASENKKSADKLLTSIQNIIGKLSSMPEIGTLFPISQNLSQKIRYLPISGFKHHLIFYAVTKDHIRVLRLLHSSRDLNDITKWE
ncbi:type II toxin-antitoxin system RelE/ParE family toxin [bacterium]|jgi:toxin ParE1/3/4|nr:type II toxin-antitoxin system RelE/ParE family toxin [bacterium]